MKVAVVCPYDLAAPGGVQDQVVGLVSRLESAGHVAWAVAPGSGGPESTRHVGGTVRVPANRSKAPISLSFRTPGRVRSAVADADVVHVHEPLMPMVSLAMMSAGTRPTVGTFHADPGGAVRGIYRAASPLLRRLVRRLDVVTAVSETARTAIARFADARIIPNAVDVGWYRHAEGDRDRNVTLFIGRDEPRKGLDVLMEAWPKVRASNPTATLQVVGAHRDRAPEGVTFLGRVTEEEKRSELANASVFAAPNLGGESFGIILIEAMASGCAVVASDLAAFRAVAGDAATMVEVGDAAALAAGIARFLSDATAVEAAVAAGERVVEQYDWSTVTQTYITAYRDAIAAAG